MAGEWTSEQLQLIDAAQELSIAARRDDGTWRTAVPIWVVRVDTQAYVRTWHRRDTGWYGQALRSHRARIEVPGLTADVEIEDIGSGTSAVRDAVDTAYRSKYGGGGTGGMLTADAVASTLRLRPA